MPASPPLLFRGWIFISSASIYSPFVGVYIYADTTKMPLPLLTNCYSAATNNPTAANNLVLTPQNSIRSPCKHIATFSVCVHSEVFLTGQRHPFFTPLTHHTPTFDLRSVFSPNLSHHFRKSILPFLSHNGYTSVFWYPTILSHFSIPFLLDIAWILLPIPQNCCKIAHFSNDKLGTNIVRNIPHKLYINI